MNTHSGDSLSTGVNIYLKHVFLDWRVFTVVVNDNPVFGLF